MPVEHWQSMFRLPLGHLQNVSHLPVEHRRIMSHMSSDLYPTCSITPSLSVLSSSDLLCPTCWITPPSSAFCVTLTCWTQLVESTHLHPPSASSDLLDPTCWITPPSSVLLCHLICNDMAGYVHLDLAFCKMSHQPASTHDAIWHLSYWTQFSDRVQIYPCCHVNCVVGPKLLDQSTFLFVTYTAT